MDEREQEELEAIRMGFLALGRYDDEARMVHHILDSKFSISEELQLALGRAAAKQILEDRRSNASLAMRRFEEEVARERVKVQQEQESVRQSLGELEGIVNRGR